MNDVDALFWSALYGLALGVAFAATVVYGVATLYLKPLPDAPPPSPPISRVVCVGTPCPTWSEEDRRADEQRWQEQIAPFQAAEHAYVRNVFLVAAILGAAALIAAALLPGRYEPLAWGLRLGGVLSVLYGYLLNLTELRYLTEIPNPTGLAIASLAFSALLWFGWVAYSQPSAT